MGDFWKDLGLKTKQLLQFAVAIASILFILYLIPKVNSFNYSYEMGKPWQYEGVYSPFDFAVIKAPKEYENSKKEVEEKHLKHYVKEEKIAQAAKEKLEKLIVSRLAQLDSLALYKSNKKDLISKGNSFLEQVYSKGIIEKTNENDLVLVENNIAKTIEIDAFYSLNEVQKQLENEDFGSLENNNILKSLLQTSLEPNIIYDLALTEDLLNNKLAQVSSTKGLVKKGEKIIGKGELVDATRNQKLLSFEKKFSEQILDESQSTKIAIGYFLLISLVVGILMLYLMKFQKYIYVSFRKYSLIFILVNASVLLTALTSQINANFVYIIPFSIVPIVLRAFFKRETALYVHICIILLAGMFVPKAYTFVFIQIVAGITAIYGNVDVRYWSQFFKAIAFIFVAYILSFIGLALMETGSLAAIKYSIIGFLALNAFLSFLAYPLIVFFEKIFGLLSDISLVEYTDLNKPLLKRLSLEAPGTFQHSLQVANLAEAAASEIKANSLLVKVGALYHDVGKIKHRIYFIENQFPEENPHEKMSYEESAKIIIAHVTDGIKLARKSGLPEQIIEFIKTHHGTTRVEYFYRMHAKVHSEDTIDENTFCYPGPTPFRKEHAILMMADSVEAASKSLKNPTRESLNKLVDGIVEYQQKRGQFDNVPITLQEISRCKMVFKKMLASIYHIRIEYPKET